MEWNNLTLIVQLTSTIPSFCIPYFFAVIDLRQNAKIRKNVWQYKGVVIKYLSWVGDGGYSRGACNIDTILRKGFKQIGKKWKRYETKIIYISKFYK